MKQIFVMGGGGFTKDVDLKFEKYLISLSDQKQPKICFLPQASNESRDYIVKFYQSFLQLGARPNYVSLFGRVQPYWQDLLLQQDIIYVGGGNTRSMLALWKEWGVDEVLREAYDRGIILSGLSAGMLCWFEQGVTDSVWPLGIVSGLGLLSGSACPHFDTEPERQHFYRHALQANIIKPGYAVDDDAGVHFVDGVVHQAVSTKKGPQVLYLEKDRETSIETMIL